MSFQIPMLSCASIRIETQTQTQTHALNHYRRLGGEIIHPDESLIKTAMIINSTHGSINVLHYAEKNPKNF